MQVRQLTRIQSGYLPESARTHRNMDGTVTITPERVPVNVRLGSMQGEIAAGFFTVRLCQYDADGLDIPELQRNVSVPITDEMRPLIELFKTGAINADQYDQLCQLLLFSDKALTEVP